MEITMRLCNCSGCGISFAMPEAHAMRLEECHNTFYCPAGHTNYYPQKSDIELMRERLLIKDRELEELKAVKAALARKKKSKSKKPNG